MNESDRLLLAYLSAHGPASRSTLATGTGMSKAAISNSSRGLLQAGIIHEVATFRNPSGHGRPSVLLDLNPDHGYLVGVMIDEDPIVMVLTNMKGAVLAEHELPLPASAAGVAEQLPEGINSLAISAGISPEAILSAGVAISGVVDSERGVCVQSANLGWYEEPVAAMISRSTGLPTFLENDANAVATAEALFGEAQGHADFTVVTIGRGIGGAQFVRGSLYRGNSGGAGELAHCTVVPGGTPCRCGKRGCLDTVASREAIIERARAAGLEVSSLSEIEELAQRGVREAVSVLHEAAGYLGLAISHLINIVDPGLVLLGAETGPATLFSTRIRRELEDNLLPYRLGKLHLKFHSLSHESWARGAASLAANAVLSGRVRAGLENEAP